MKRIERAFLILLATGILLVGCEKEQSTAVLAPEHVTVSLQNPFKGGDIAAKVNNEPVFSEEVEFTIGRMFSDMEQAFANKEAMKNILESLVAARAMRQKQESTLTEDDRQEIEAKVWAYREELYVKAYLQQHAVAEPVTQEMVEAYYLQHPEKFGGGSRKQFELLRTTTKPPEEKRDSILTASPVIKEEKSWANYAETTRSKLGLVYQQGEQSAGLLDKALEEQVSRMQVGEVAGPLFFDGIPYLIRVVSVRTMAPKPLSEISADIRKNLAPLQLRTAVKRASDEIVNASEIEYIAD